MRSRAIVGFAALPFSCLLLTSCGQDVLRTPLGEARSPNGRWVATAVHESWGGPGTAWDDAVVYLQQGSREKTQVVGFNQRFQEMHVAMTWLTPTHLEVAYGATVPGDSISIGFQVARIGDEVDISLRKLSSSATSH